MKKLIIIIFLTISLLFGLTLQGEYNLFTQQQKDVLYRAYELGKPFNMGYTLAAIAWQESSAGKYLVNMQDPSAGVFHNNLKSVLSRHELEYSSWNINKTAQRLIENMDFSAAEALAELEFWQTIHGQNNWKLIWQSYNGGFAYLNPFEEPFKNSEKYSKEIKKKVDFLKVIIKE